MALIKCKFCGATVSNKSKKCVNCNKPIKLAIFNRNKKKIYILIIVAIAILSIYHFRNDIMNFLNIDNASENEYTEKIEDKLPYQQTYILLSDYGKKATIEFLENGNCQTDFSEFNTSLKVASTVFNTKFHDQKHCSYEIINEKEFKIRSETTYDIYSQFTTIIGTTENAYLHQNVLAVQTDNQEIIISFNDDYSEFDYINGNWYTGGTIYKIYYAHDDYFNTSDDESDLDNYPSDDYTPVEPDSDNSTKECEPSLGDYNLSSGYSTIFFNTDCDAIYNGQSVTATFVINGAASWNIKLEGSGSTDNCSMHHVDTSPDGKNKELNFTITCKSTSSGKIKFNIVGEVIDENYNSTKFNKEILINVYP